MSFRTVAPVTRFHLLLGEGADRAEVHSLNVRGNIHANELVPEGLNRLCFFAGVESPSVKISLIFLGIMAALFCAAITYGIFWAGAVVVIPIGLYWFSLDRRAHNRSEAFERDYTAFLLSMASSIRTGLDPIVALSECAKLFPQDSVLAKEICKTAEDISLGLEEEAAFRQFAQSIRHPDISLLRSALILSRQQGSSLGSCLHRLARVTRQRQSFRRKVRGAVAMQRLSAFGIAGCTVVIGMIQVSSNPRALADAWGHPVGHIAISFGIGLVVFGLGAMLYMSRRRL
jgi:Flp pilus assembly protein TadB